MIFGEKRKQPPPFVMAAELKAWRERHCWTAVIAAAMLNTPFDTYRGWEKYRAPGVVRVAMETLDKLYPVK